VGRLVRPPNAEGWIGQNYIETVSRWRLVNGVSKCNLRLQVVKVEVHERHAPRSVHVVLTKVGCRSDALHDVAVQSAAGGSGLQPFVSGHKKTTSAACRITDGEVATDARVGLHAAHNGLDQDAGRKNSACPFLPFGR